MRTPAIVTLWLMTASVPAPGLAQVVIDKVVGRVGGDIITQSDLRQARMLKLFGPSVAESDEALLRAIENRRLLLTEASRASLGEPSAERQAAQRRQWAARLGSGADVAKMLERGGMSQSAIDDWCRDDVIIDSYLAERFKSVPEADRAAELDKLVRDLRRRAGLK